MVHFFHENLNILDLIRKEKKYMLRLLQLMNIIVNLIFYLTYKSNSTPSMNLYDKTMLYVEFGVIHFLGYLLRT